MNCPTDTASRSGENIEGIWCVLTIRWLLGV